MYSPSRLVRLHHRLSRRFCSSPNPNPNPNGPICSSMKTTLKALFKEQDPDKLASEFKRHSESPAFRRRNVAYEIVVLRLAAARRFDAVEDILEHQKRYPDAVSSEGFAARLISLYGRAGMLDCAATTFHHLPALGCPRTALSFNALLTVFARSKNSDQTTDLFREIPSSDPSIIPNTVSYNILIFLHCEKGDLDAALDTLDLMEKGGIAPDSITFNTLLNGSYGKGRISDGERIWAQMIEKNISPNTMSFNAKLRGLVSEGKVSDAVEVLDEMNLVGLKPDSFSFDALIKGYCREGDLVKAKTIYDELAENGCAPIRWTFETLIPRLREAGELNSALKLCNESITHRCFLDAAVVQGVVDELVRTARLDEAKKLVKLGTSRSYLRKNLKMPLSCLFA